MKKQKEVEYVKKLLDQLNFAHYHGVRYNYESRKSHDHGEKCKNDYCRCSRIEDTKIESVDAIAIADSIISYFNLDKKDLILRYCIERLCRTIRSDTSDFHFDISGGYYGQELRGVFLRRKDLEDKIREIIQEKDNSERIRIVLIEEYGYLLDSLKNCKFVLKTLNTNSVFFGKTEHYKKLEKDTIKYYTDRNVEIFGIVDKKESGNTHIEVKHRVGGSVELVDTQDYWYKIVDGYHRCKSAQDKKLKKIKVLVIENEN